MNNLFVVSLKFTQNNYPINKLIYLYIACLISFAPCAHTQDEIADFQDFTLDEGLSSANVIFFFQDSRGIIWIGTSYGLNRYDGASIKSYTKEDNGLCHNYINNIAEDGKGNLWLQAGDFGRQESYFCILDPFTDRIYSVEEYTGQPCPFDPNKTFLNPNYHGIFLLQENRDHQIQFYEVKSDKIVKGFTYSIEKSPLVYPRRLIGTIKLDEETYIFNSPKETVEEGFRFEIYHLKSNGSIVNNSFGNTKALESSQILHSDGAHFYYQYHNDSSNNNNNNSKVPPYLSFFKDGKFIAKANFVPNLVTPFLINGNIYTFYNNRVEVYNLSENNLKLKQSISLDRKLLFPSAVPLVDRGGNLWLPGINKITKLSFRPKNFKSHLNDKIKSYPIPIRGIYGREDGTIYAGTLNGLSRIKPRNNEAGFEYEKNIVQNGVLGLLYDKGKIWLGTERYGLQKYDVNTKELVHYGEELVWQPYKAPDGTIWVGAGQGLFKLDQKKNKLLPFPAYGIYKELEKSSIYAFHLNDKGTWLSTSSGMYLVDLVKEKVLAQFNDKQAGTLYLPANHIAHIYEDKEGVFWLATKGQGLIRWNPTTGKSEQFTRGNTGLSHNVIYAVYEDNFGRLWLPSEYGLNRFNKSTHQVTIYLEEDGLPNNEFNTISHHQDKDGHLFFGTIDGMIEFNPKDFSATSDKTPFIITTVNRIDQKTDSIINMTKSVLENHSITIEPSDKAVVFSFALLDYKKTKGNQYSYKIQGYQDRWTYQKDANVRISDLPYGQYKLFLRGKASGSNNWIDYAHPIEINVVKPFYLQWWFILCCLLVLVGSVLYIIRRNTKVLLERQHELESEVQARTEEIRLQAEELKQLDKVKSKFFANISHELRTPLTLILGPLSFILDNPDEWEKENIQKQMLVMQRNGKSLMQLIEEILDLSKLEANKLELVEAGTSVMQFFEFKLMAFEPQLQNQGLDYQLILDIKDDLNILMDRNKVEKIFNNFLSNAIKFTPKGGKVSIRVSETEDKLHFMVADTGKGIHPRDLPHVFDRFYQSKQADQELYGGTGIGLALVKEFTELMGGNVHVESTLGEGAQFYFEMPKKEVSQKEILLPAMVDLNEDEIYSIGKDFTIMIVEDNNDMRDFIYQLLQEKYTNILLARNGVEALEVLNEHGTNIHLIVSDVMMPEMDGLTMLKEIKNHKEWFAIPIVMLTALAAERDKLKALTIGVDDYLTKPFSVPELLIRVQNLLFNYQQRLDWQASDEFQYQDEEDIMDEVEKAIISEKDKEWVDKLTKLVEASYNNGLLDVESLAAAQFISSRQLNRKLKSITGLSTAKFIREVQLMSARKELENGTFISILEVAYNAGFDNHSNFTRLFKNRYGKTPSEYINH